jgi:hypothetical protein
MCNGRHREPSNESEKAFLGRVDDLTNITVKKIPKAVLARCEFGKDDYSLKVANLPSAPTMVLADVPPPKPKKGRKPDKGPTLFDKIEKGD